MGWLEVAQVGGGGGGYGLGEADFFGGTIEKEIAPWELDEDQMATVRLLDDLHALPKVAQRSLVPKFQLMVDAIADVQPERGKHTPPFRREDSPEWHMLNSRN